MMRTLSRIGQVWLLSLALQCGAAAQDVVYSAEPIDGWVIDTDTGRPLPGVIVVADWSLETGIMDLGRGGELVLLETETDADGRYAFPGWGPKTLSEPNTFLWNRDPLLIFMKPGYRDEFRSNGTTRGPDRIRESLRTSRWTGKQIAMTSLHGDEAAATRQFNERTDIKMMIGSGRACEWQQMPMTIAMLVREGERLYKLGYRIYRVNPLSFTNQDRCGSAVIWAEKLPR